jgi:dihydropteroate synthase
LRFNVRVLKTVSLKDAERHLRHLAPSDEGFGIMLPKLKHYLVQVEGLDTRAANILKQNMLSIGGEVSLPRDVFGFDGQTSSCIISGTSRHFHDLFTKLTYQPFGLRKLNQEMQELLANLEGPRARGLELAGRVYDLDQRTLIMGIVNVTPDSFSDGGRFYARDHAVEEALRQAAAGADILDVGGESTRPGSDFISLEEELERVIPVIEEIAARAGVPVSVDTTKAEVARRALEAGAAMVNDISAMRLDPAMPAMVAEAGVPVCLMHMQGLPKDMQDNPTYDDLMGEVLSFLRVRAEEGEKAGISPDRILLDPGIGFGKTGEDNLEIIRRLEELKGLGYPLLLGPSRKSFIGRVLDLPVEQRLEGSAAAVAVGIANGADIVRVHDVAEMARVARVTNAILGKGASRD